MPFLYVDDLKETIHTLKEQNIKSYAAHLDGKNTYDKEDYRQGTAFLIGNEGNGTVCRHLDPNPDVWTGGVIKCGGGSNSSDV